MSNKNCKRGHTYTHTHKREKIFVHKFFFYIFINKINLVQHRGIKSRQIKSHRISRDQMLSKKNRSIYTQRSWCTIYTFLYVYHRFLPSSLFSIGVNVLSPPFINSSTFYRLFAMFSHHLCRIISTNLLHSCVFEYFIYFMLMQTSSIFIMFV